MESGCSDLRRPSSRCEAATFSANQLRAILHVYRATNLYKFTVKRNGNVITVSRVGSWEGIQQAPG